MWCPSCGEEYRPGYTTCADCGVALTATPPVQSGDGGESEEPAVYDLGEWSSEERTALSLLLARANIRHTFEGAGELVVRPENAGVVEAIMDSFAEGEDEEALGDDETADALGAPVVSEATAMADRLLAALIEGDDEEAARVRAEHGGDGWDVANALARLLRDAMTGRPETLSQLPKSFSAAAQDEATTPGPTNWWGVSEEPGQPPQP